MYLHFLLNAGIGTVEISGTGFLIAIAVFACLLGVEVAGISILISKMSRARREKQEMEIRERNSNDRYHYGLAVVMLGAVPQTTYVALSVLAGLVAIAAIVFAVVLFVVYKKGYLFVSPRDVSALISAEQTAKEAPVPEAPVSGADENIEDAPQESYIAFEEQSEDDTVFSVFEEDTETPTVEEFFEEVYEEDLSQEEAEALEGEVIVESAAEEGLPEAPATPENPTFADGSQPYKIVEKIVTETQKEVVREVPVAPSKSDAAAEQLMEKLTDFLDYELQKRKEADLAENADSDDGTVATFSQRETALDNEDIEDEDENEEEDDLDDIEDVKSEDEDDIDDEEPDSEDRFTGNERIIGFDENTGCYIVAHYRKSFEAKLIQARPRIKQYYSELKNALLAYKGTKSRISWTADSFHNGRAQIAKINVKTNILELYLALDPETLEGTVYRGRNVGTKKKYADTPFQYKLRTPRKFKWAMELVQRVCEEQGLSPIDIEKVDYEQLYPFESTESLVERKLIKEYIREEKPATTFELAPDHVPSVPDEDDSVIPANANFSWEFDNEMLALKEEENVEEEPIEEVVEEAEEPEIVAEKVAEEAPEAVPASATNVVKETIKITEMRYTERYYADAEPSYEQIITTQESISPNEMALSEDAEPADEEELGEVVAESSVLEDDFVAEEDEEFLEEQSSDEDLSEAEDGEEEYFFEEDSEWSDLSESGVQDEPEEYAEEYVEEVYEEAPEEYVEEVYEEEPEEYVEEIYEEEPEEYVEEVYEEEPEEYVEEVYEEEPEEYVEEVYEEEPEEEYVEEVYEEEPEEYAEEEVYEGEEIYVEEEPIEPVAKAPRRTVPEQPNVDPTVAVIDICSVAQAFNDGDTVNLETLKAKGLVVSNAKTLKIYAGGTLDKRLSVEAHHFSLEAIFAIGTVGGETSMLY